MVVRKDKNYKMNMAQKSTEMVSMIVIGSRYVLQKCENSKQRSVNSAFRKKTKNIFIINFVLI